MIQAFDGVCDPLLGHVFSFGNYSIPQFLNIYCPYYELKPTELLNEQPTSLFVKKPFSSNKQIYLRPACILGISMTLLVYNYLQVK